MVIHSPAQVFGMRSLAHLGNIHLAFSVAAKLFSRVPFQIPTSNIWETHLVLVLTSPWYCIFFFKLHRLVMAAHDFNL